MSFTSQDAERHRAGLIRDVQRLEKPESLLLVAHALGIARNDMTSTSFKVALSDLLKGVLTESNYHETCRVEIVKEILKLESETSLICVARAAYIENSDEISGSFKVAFRDFLKAVDKYPHQATQQHIVEGLRSMVVPDANTRVRLADAPSQPAPEPESLDTLVNKLSKKEKLDLISKLVQSVREEEA